MKSGKSLVYMLLQGSTHWDLEKLSPVMLLWDHQLESDFTNIALDIKVILQKYGEVDDDHYISIDEAAHTLCFNIKC